MAGKKSITRLILTISIVTVLVFLITAKILLYFGAKHDYYLCENTLTGEQVFEDSFCGIDTCSYTYYDKNGEILDQQSHCGLFEDDVCKSDIGVTNCKNIFFKTVFYFLME